MLMPPVARGVKKRCRRRAPAERPVVADIGPDVSLDRLALGQDWHAGVVAVQPHGRQNMALDQRWRDTLDKESPIQALMSRNRKTTLLAAAALLVSGLSLVGDATTDARAESAYPNVGWFQ
jgi:hypothetical protein